MQILVMKGYERLSVNLWRQITILLVLLLSSKGMAASHAKVLPDLVDDGQPKAAIVTGSATFDRFIAGEVQRYLEKLSGARLPIVGPEEARRQPINMAWLVIGEPQANELVREAISRKHVTLDGLQPDGFILRTVRLDGRKALIVSGNHEAATMYGAYDLLERYGIVFLVTEDVIPGKKPHLKLLDLNVRSNPAFKKRGIYTTFEYPNRSLMSLKDWHHFLDQMAKLKFNYLHIQWYPYEPWLKYEYRGEVKWMGDVSKIQTGYMLRSYDFGHQLTSEMTVGRKYFEKAGIYPRLAPPEFQTVKNNEQVFEVAQPFLRNIVDYAHTRKIAVWLGIDATSVAPNLARYTTRTFNRPFDQIFGSFLCPDNPVSLALNDARLTSLIKTYPDADGFFLWLPEGYPVCYRTAQDREFYLSLRPKYLGEGNARAAWTGDITMNNDQLVDSNGGSIYFIQQLMQERDRIAPDVKLGVAAYGHLYLWPFIDKMFLKDVPFDEMESSAIWTPTGVPMNLFAGMRGRDNTIINRIDDDSDMLGMQFNVRLYDKDEVLISSVKYGVSGFASQAYRDPETEWNIKYMSEGGWNPYLNPEAFYHDYATRIFGNAASPQMFNAFETLEKNEELLGWNGRGNFPCCGPPEELTIAYDYWKQPDLYDGPAFPTWRGFISRAHDQILYFTHSVKLLQEALQEMQSAQIDSAPGSRKRLAYLINRTEVYILYLQTLVRWEQAYIDFDRAFQIKSQHGTQAEFLQRLDRSLREFEAVRQMARDVATTWVQAIDYPASDLGVLYRVNTWVVTGTELTDELMQNVDNFWHGHNYLHPVDFGKVFTEWPVLKRAAWPGV